MNDKDYQTFLETARSLIEVRDKELYKPEYKTFEKYCQEKWGLGPKQIAQYLSIASEHLNRLN